MKTIFISTGEVSGDLQGSLLVSALKRLAEKSGIELNIVALGGQRMAAAGATLIADTTAISSMGVWEALAYIAPTIRVQNLAKNYLKNSPPDAIVLIDYMTPNIVIGNYAKLAYPDVPIIFYIAPQDWVWDDESENSNKIAKFSTEILSIFPAEAEYFQKRGARVQYVGHPLVDRVASIPPREIAREKLGINSHEIAVALIPASRQQELKYLMPVIFQAAQQIQSKLPNVRFWIPLARTEFKDEIERAIDQFKINATLVTEHTELVLAAADLAIAKSGTVSLELALLKVPHVVIYRLSKLTAWIAKHIVKLKLPFISPTNLVEMKPIVPELLQDDANADRIATEALELILNTDRRDRMLTDYQHLSDVLGEAGVCDRVAKAIMANINIEITA
jgi:lipid-A-disaccharide synthase